MTDAKFQARLQNLLDRTEIFDLVRVERFHRDQRNWKGLVGSYVPNAPVRTTWFDGTIEGFAEASRRKMEEQGSTAKHWIFPTMLRIVDGRATVESPAMIFDRITFDNIQFDVFQYCRFFSRVLQTDAGWRLASFEGIYQWDRFQTVNPSDPLPVDWESAQDAAALVPLPGLHAGSPRLQGQSGTDRRRPPRSAQRVLRQGNALAGDRGVAASVSILAGHHRDWRRANPSDSGMSRSRSRDDWRARWPPRPHSHRCGMC